MTIQFFDPHITSARGVAALKPEQIELPMVDNELKYTSLKENNFVLFNIYLGDHLMPTYKQHSSKMNQWLV